MRKLLLLVCVLCISAALAAAQGKIDSQWNCGKATDAHNLEVGDQPAHTYGIAKFTCTAVKGEIEGAKEKEGAGTEFDDVEGSKMHGHGIFVESLANGDKLFVQYQTSGTLDKDGQLTSGSNTWTITNGTGKLKGAKGKGGCKGKGNADGSSVYDCMGEYTLAK